MSNPFRGFFVASGHNFTFSPSPPTPGFVDFFFFGGGSQSYCKYTVIYLDQTYSNARKQLGSLCLVAVTAKTFDNLCIFFITFIFFPFNYLFSSKKYSQCTPNSRSYQTLSTNKLFLYICMSLTLCNIDKRIGGGAATLNSPLFEQKEDKNFPSE